MHGNAHRCRGQGGGVIDTVADHDDGAVVAGAMGQLLADDVEFLFGQQATDGGIRCSCHDLGGRVIDRLESRGAKPVYLLAGNRLRITGQLIETATGAHSWADRFDGALGDIFELQDQVASSVAGAIEPKLRQSEIERAARKPTESLDA